MSSRERAAASGQLTRSTGLCGTTRFGRSDRVRNAEDGMFKGRQSLMRPHWRRRGAAQFIGKARRLPQCWPEGEGARRSGPIAADAVDRRQFVIPACS